MLTLAHQEATRDALWGVGEEGKGGEGRGGERMGKVGKEGREGRGERRKGGRAGGGGGEELNIIPCTTDTCNENFKGFTVFNDLQCTL